MSWVRVVQLLLSLSSSAQRVVLRLAVEALGDAGLDAVNAPPRIGEALCVKNKTKYIDDDMFTMVIIRHLTRAHTYRELISGRGVGVGWGGDSRTSKGQEALFTLERPLRTSGQCRHTPSGTPPLAQPPPLHRQGGHSTTALSTQG